jgi:tetratricopeptide (TPR) repeat protein
MNNDDARRWEDEIGDAWSAGDLARAEARTAAYCREAAAAAEPDELAHSPRFRAPYLAGQVALAAGKMSQALEYFTPLLPNAGRLPPMLAARLRLLAAEAYARRQFELEARELLGQVPAVLLENEPVLHLRALRIRLWLDEVSQVGEELLRCDRALEERGDTSNRALLACEEGRAWDRAGDLPRASECLLRAERLVAPGKAGRDDIRADILLQLGRFDHIRGNLAAALERFDQAGQCAMPGAQTLEVRLRSLLVRLDLHPEDKECDAVRRLLQDQTLEQLPEEVRPSAAMVGSLLDGAPAIGASDELQAYLAAARGDVAASRSLYEKAFAKNPSPERRARLALALGLLALAHGDRQEALSWLSQAEDLARSWQLPEVLIRTLAASGQMAAEQEGDEERARQFFEEAVLVAEVQAGQFLNIIHVQAYRQQRVSVLRYLLHSACRRGDAGRVFHYQELERGRFLLDLLNASGEKTPGLALFEQPALAELTNEIAECDQELLAMAESPSFGGSRRELLRRREELQLRRDRLLEEFLRDHRRRGDAVLPVLPGLEDLQRTLPAKTLYLAPTFIEDELYLLVAAQGGPSRVLRASGSARTLGQALRGLRGCLDTQLERYRQGLSAGSYERAELDEWLDVLGRSSLGEALAEAVARATPRPQRILWVPDGVLHGLPVHALRRENKYLIEDLEFVWSFSGSLVVHQARNGPRRGMLRPAVVIAERPDILPEAEREGKGVAASFLWCRKLKAGAVDRKALRSWLARARVVHFACHAHFDGRHPLAACIHLPSGEDLHALEWLREPVAGLGLMTLSACRSAEVGQFVGQEVFGLVTGLLGGGVRAVLAGMWPVADREVPPLMWRFYRNRLVQELPTALALAQREALADPASSPLYWAAFALFGDAAALPPPGIWRRWLARHRQRRHLRRFPV